jgi:hypothetical protein
MSKINDYLQRLKRIDYDTLRLAFDNGDTYLIKRKHFVIGVNIPQEMQESYTNTSVEGSWFYGEYND